jgi:hypothetical protein
MARSAVLAKHLEAVQPRDLQRSRSAVQQSMAASISHFDRSLRVAFVALRGTCTFEALATAQEMTTTRVAPFLSTIAAGPRRRAEL